MTLWPILAFVVGLALLTIGADRFVLASVRLSRAFGVSPILIGALVIGLGTSAPELLVSGLAAARGEVDLAIGNVIGSNTANMTLVLGGAALLTPVVSRVRTLQREGLTMFLSLVLVTAMTWNLWVGRLEAAVLLGAMALASGLLVLWARNEPETGDEPEDDLWKGSTRFEVIIGLLMLGLTLLGAELLVRGASRIATDLGVSAAFVGLVVVSVGTSLPEFATAIASARRGATDFVVGNVLGSNLFNSLAVAGLAGLVGPGALDPAFRGALAVMLLVGVVAGFFVFTARRLDRWEGAVLIALFGVFVWMSM
jgi:cation:H+ antiporter